MSGRMKDRCGGRRMPKVNMGRLRRGFCALLLVLLPVLLSGCRRQAEQDGLLIGVSINSLRSPFMIALAQGIREGAEQEGVRLILSDCNGDLHTQASQISDFVIQKVDGILIEPLDEDALVQSVKDAREAGIPVYCVDTTVKDSAVNCTVGSDSVAMGQTAARYIVNRLHDKYGAYRGRVVNLLASVNTTSGRDRSRGFHQIIDQYPDIEIVAEQNGALQLDTAMNAMTNILQANPEIDAIWCSGDTNAQGAIQAMRWLELLKTRDEEGHIILVSADGAAESMAAIREGIMDACISQNPLEMGRMAVRLMKQELGEGKTPPLPFMTYPLYVITPENIDTEEHVLYGVWSEEIPQ